jgi:hypothetical protein
VRRRSTGRDQGSLVLGVLVENEGLFAGEVLEQGRGGDVGGLGDISHRDLIVAVFQEEPERRVGQGLAGGGLLALPAPHRHLGHARSLHHMVV